MAFTTWNPSDKSANCVLTNSNLTCGANAASQGARSVDSHLAGKYYWEYTWNLTQATDCLGISAAGASLTQVATIAGQRCLLNQPGSVFLNGGTAVGGVGGAVTAGSVICIALDCSSSLIWFRVGAAGNWNNSAGNNPATGVGGIVMGAVLGGLALFAHAFTAAATANVVANFGDSAFTGAVPAGFTAGWPGVVPIGGPIVNFTLPASRAGAGSVIVTETDTKTYNVAGMGVITEGGPGSGSGGGTGGGSQSVRVMVLA